MSCGRWPDLLVLFFKRMSQVVKSSVEIPTRFFYGQNFLSRFVLAQGIGAPSQIGSRDIMRGRQRVMRYRRRQCTKINLVKHTSVLLK